MDRPTPHSRTWYFVLDRIFDDLPNRNNPKKKKKDIVVYLAGQQQQKKTEKKSRISWIDYSQTFSAVMSQCHVSRKKFWFVHSSSSILTPTRHESARRTRWLDQLVIFSPVPTVSFRQLDFSCHPSIHPHRSDKADTVQRTTKYIGKFFESLAQREPLRAVHVHHFGPETGRTGRRDRTE